LVEAEPTSWPIVLGRPAGPTTVIDADIATVSGAADKVLRVAADTPYLLYLEFVAGHDAVQLPRKLHMRNGLLEYRHDLLVRSCAVLLHPEADSPQLTGRYLRQFPDEDEEYLKFRYQVLRVWLQAPELFLGSSLSLLPLAPISDVTEDQLPGIIKRMDQRLQGRRARQHASQIWDAAFILSGLRYSPTLVAQLFRGVMSMRESSTYQAILEEGRDEGAVREARKVLRLLGDKAYGPPDAATTAQIERLDDLARLEEVLQRLGSAASWQDLLGQPPTGRRGKRRPSS
jgi:predicted transposase YdaD